MDNLYLGAARIHLHSFYFLDSSVSEARKLGIMKAYRSAINFVTTLLSTEITSKSIQHMPYYPLRTVLTASCMLLKVLKSSYGQELDIVGTGRKAFNDCILVMTRASVSGSDSAGKVVKMLSRAWHSDVFDIRSPPVLSVKSRFGARLVTLFFPGF